MKILIELPDDDGYKLLYHLENNLDLLVVDENMAHHRYVIDGGDVTAEEMPDD